MKYTQRLNAFKPTTIWQVMPSGLKWSDDKGGAGQIPWGKIKTVRLRLEPSRAERRRVALHIHAPFPYTITNIHYKGPMNFKAQTDEFRGFIRVFHAGFPKDSQTEFHKGSTQGAYIGNVVITGLLLALMFFLAPILSITGIPSISTIARIGIIIIFLPTLLKLLVKNKPEMYNPNQVPLEMLD